MLGTPQFRRNNTDDQPVESPAASRTAVLVCQGRAVADGRWAVGRFEDPIARELLSPDERLPVDQARAEQKPHDWKQRRAFESVRACGEVIVPRTVAIDDAIRAAACPQVVIVGAGLDSRPWRLDCLGETTVFVVDHPASQADAAERLAAREPRAGRLVWVPADLARGELDGALAAVGHDPLVPTMWVWEGVIPYLTTEEAASTVQVFRDRSALDSGLVINYQLKSWATVLEHRVGRLAARVLRLDDPLGGEPWRSLWTPASIRRLLGQHFFTVDTDEGLLTIARRIGSPAAHGHLLGASRVVTARRIKAPADERVPQPTLQGR